jgi:hypothetical protein
LLWVRVKVDNIKVYLLSYRITLLRSYKVLYRKAEYNNFSWDPRYLTFVVIHYDNVKSK